MSKGTLKRVFKRVVSAEERVSELEAMAKRYLGPGARVFKAPSLERRVAAVSALQHLGVSASSVPHVLAVTANLFFGAGKVRTDDLVAPSTATEWARLQGAVLDTRVRQQLCGEGPRIPFFVGTDTSNRGGSIASYVVSFVPRGRTEPEIHFMEFRQSLGSDAECLAAGIKEFVDGFEGAFFCGLSSDAPATMIGRSNGVGEILCRAFGRFIRHDTCEHHASACLARVVENMFPAQMNVPSVTQFCYLAWYLMNDDWPQIRALMHAQLRKCEAEMDDGIAAMLRAEQDPCRLVKETASRLLESSDLNKPDKPSSNRWKTQADMIFFVHRFWRLLVVVFDEVREYLGAGAAAVPGSRAQLATQWIKWAGSAKLHALIEVSVEFLAVWRIHDRLISLPGEDFEAHCYHKVFSRPDRARGVLMNMELALEKATNEPEEWESYPMMVAAYPGQFDEVRQLYVQMYRMGIDRVKRNSGRYLSGVYAYAGFGDVASVALVWEAFSHFKNHAKKPQQRTRIGKRMEEWLREGEKELSVAHAQEFRKLTNKQHLDDAYKLVAPLLTGREPTEDQRRVFVATIQSSKDNLVAKQLLTWRAALSSTQPVEKTFLDYDSNVAKNSGAKKAKKSQPTGKGPQLGLAVAKVRFAQMAAKVEREKLEKVNAREKTNLKKLQSKGHIRDAWNEKLSKMVASKEELKAARKRVRPETAALVTPRGGVSAAMTAHLDHLEQQYHSDTFRHARKKMAALMVEGNDMDVDISFECFPSDQCVRRESKRGRPGRMFACRQCLKRFHAKCLVEAGILAKKPAKDATVVFDCPECSGVAAE